MRKTRKIPACRKIRYFHAEANPAYQRTQGRKSARALAACFGPRGKAQFFRLARELGARDTVTRKAWAARDAACADRLGHNAHYFAAKSQA